MTVLDPGLRTRLERAPVAALSQQLRRRGLDHVTIGGVQPIGAVRKLVGVARTLRFVPFREDLFDRHGGGYNVQKQTFDTVGTDEVIVIGARGVADAGTLGDVLAWRARTRGAAGIVSDGGVRDADAVGAIGIPVFAAGPHPAVLGRRHVPWDAQIAVACGGATVCPGDIIVGDADGVIVIPPPIVSEVVDDALAQEELDAWVVERVREGHPVEGLFPPDARWRALFDAEHESATGHAR